MLLVQKVMYVQGKEWLQLASEIHNDLSLSSSETFLRKMYKNILLLLGVLYLCGGARDGEVVFIICVLFYSCLHAWHLP